MNVCKNCILAIVNLLILTSTPFAFSEEANPSNLAANLDDSAALTHSLVLTSPAEVEANQNELLYISALLNNPQVQDFKAKIILTSPVEWGDSSHKMTNVDVPGNDFTIHIAGIRVPGNTLAGKYQMSIEMTSADDSLPFEAIRETITVIVRPKVEMTARLEELQEVYLTNQTVHLNLNCFNNGNIPLNVRLETQLEPQCAIESSKYSFEILPLQSQPLYLQLEPTTDQEYHQQFLIIKLFDEATGLLLFQQPMTLRFESSQINQDDPWIRIPAHTTFYAFANNGEHGAGVEFAGGGVIDPEREGYLDFFFRIPTNSHNVIYNIDQQMYVGLGERGWDLELGDTSYNLTPLTQRNRYGRGAAVDFYNDKWEVGVQYNQTPFNSCYNPKETGAYIEFSPTAELSISGNVLHKEEKNCPQANILSLFAETEFPNKIYSEMEIAKNLEQNKKGRDRLGYYFHSNGLLFNDTWFDVEKIYAGSEFNGYYQNVNQLAAALDFPILANVRGNVGMNHSTQNCGFECEKFPDLIVPHQRLYTANLSCDLWPGLNLGVNGMHLRAKDLGNCEQFNFNQKWGGVTLSSFYKEYALNLNASFGSQIDYLTLSQTNYLQKYYLSLQKKITPNLLGALFYEGGNLDFYDAKPWRTAFGGSLSYRYSNRGWLELYAQKVKHNIDFYNLYQISGSLTHTFKNFHKLQLSAQYFHYESHYPNNTMALIAYSVPFKLPFGKRKDIGSVKGCIYDVWQNRAIPDAMVNCQNKRVVTDAQGSFEYPTLATGEHQLKTDLLPDNLVTKEKQTFQVCVRGGEKNIVLIPVVPACSISGILQIFEYEDCFQFFADMENRDEIAPVLRGGLANINLIISRNDGIETYSAATDINGRFHFPKLRPGQWTIKFNHHQIPNLYDLIIETNTFDIEPGEDKQLIYKVLQKKPTIQLLE